MRFQLVRSREAKVNFLYNLITLVIAVVFLFPVYWLVMMSFKSDAEIFSPVLTYFPHRFTVEPWLLNIRDKEFFTSLRNSCIIATMSMCLSMLIGIPAAYGMGRYKVPGRRIMLLAFLVSQMLPPSLMLTPMYLIFNKMGLLGTFWAPVVAISSGSIPFIVIILRSYFNSIPKSLDDAARIDGCNALQSFFLIMLPAIKTGIITVAVISFLGGWNDLAYSMTFNVMPEMRPLTANIYKFQSKYGTRWNAIMAYGAILVTPVVLAFVFLQKYIVGGLTAGAVKE